jgi:hypothetical protein
VEWTFRKQKQTEKVRAAVNLWTRTRDSFRSELSRTLSTLPDVYRCSSLSHQTNTKAVPRLPQTCPSNLSFTIHRTVNTAWSELLHIVKLKVTQQRLLSADLVLAANQEPNWMAP